MQGYYTNSKPSIHKYVGTYVCQLSYIHVVVVVVYTHVSLQSLHGLI